MEELASDISAPTTERERDRAVCVTMHEGFLPHSCCKFLGDQRQIGKENTYKGDFGGISV